MSFDNSTKDAINAAKRKMSGSAGNKAAAAKEAAYPAVAEPALVHPFTNAVIKLRDNGAIDVFTGDNIGIRIDQNNKSINMMSTLVQTRAETLRAIINKDAQYDVKGKWTINAGSATINTKGATKVNAKGNMSLETASKLSIKAASLDINVAGSFKAFAGDYDWR